MKGQELKILFKDNLAFLTEEVALNFKQVEISDLPVRFKASAFWTIRVINYIESEHKLFVEVLSYQVGEAEFSRNQIELTDILISIEKVTFRSIDTTGLLRTLNSTQPVKIVSPKPEIVYRRETPILPQAIIQTEPVSQTYNEPFSISIKDVTFLLGKVVFKKKIQRFHKPVEFEIPNDNIIEEYDAIKNYFASVLKTKKIQVIPTIITTDGVITSVSGTSAEIDRIDKTFVEEVKFEFIKTVRSKETSDDKQLFTIDEYLETLASEDFKAQQLFKDENDFFETLLEKSETKHYKHLRFLSSKHNADEGKLRFVHKPFSFVFLLSNLDKFHIVWETLDTQEATYIWTVDKNEKDLKQALTQIDKTINLIIKDGRNEYRRQKEENFNRVVHDYADLQNGFKNWKEEIEKILM